MRIIFVITSLFFFVSCGTKTEVKDPVNPFNKSLNLGWEFSMQGEDRWRDAEVPGSIQLDLIRNGAIADPYRDTKEHDISFLESKNWTYKNTFHLSEAERSQDHLFLVFDGIDTYGDVYLNQQLILTTDNAHRSWEVDVSGIVQDSNELVIELTSPMNKNKTIVQNLGYQLPSGSEDGDIKVGNFTRKPSFQFGWDWAPRIVAQGIHGDVWLECRRSFDISNILVQTNLLSENQADLVLKLEYFSFDEDVVSIEFMGERLEFSVEEGSSIIEVPFSIDDPLLWWPNEVGEQHLYTELLTVSTSNDSWSEDVSFGVRTIELIQEADAIGTSYAFKVNGKDVFMKGANYVPMSSMYTEIGFEDKEKLLMLAKDAHFNMIRVWGGGIYETDEFYSLCDEFGILVWQDFMFAGSMYPSHAEFNKTVEKEVEEQVKRIGAHPCCALFCGNNEMDVAWHNWGWQKQFNYSSVDSAKVWSDYLNLFESTIPNLVSKYSDIDYVSTSPLSNWGTPENFNHSSMHYWGVWHGGDDFSDFRTNVGRFMVEYGFQSFPRFDLLSNYISGDLSLSHPGIDSRQKSYVGNGILIEFMKKYGDMPTSFEQFVFESQKVQAIGLETAIKEHRLKKGHCMGTLFWQFNDCWPGPSWSVVESDLEPKLAYSSVQKWYSPIIAIRSGEQLWLINDYLDPKWCDLDFFKNGELIESRTEVIQEKEAQFMEVSFDYDSLVVKSDSKVEFKNSF